MNRRTYLKVVVGATLGAGCLARQRSTDTNERSTTSTATGNETTAGSGPNTKNGTERKIGETESDTGDGSSTEPNSDPVIVNRSFDIISGECGGGKNQARVSSEDHAVRVTGTISGSNSCYTAELEHATLEQQTLVLNVRSFEPDTDELCSMCLKEIKYESVCTFDHELPEQVVVFHNERQISSQ